MVGSNLNTPNQNYINTNSDFVCNITNQFKDHINLSNFHPSNLGH